MVAEGGEGGEVAAHAVDASSWGGGGAAEVKAGVGGAVLAEGGAGEELGESHGAAGDVAAGEVGVPGREGGGVVGDGGEEGVAEVGREAGDLVEDGLGVVGCVADGDMNVGPGSVLAFRCAGAVEEAGLDEKDIGIVVRTARGRGVALGSGDLFERAA